jgi:endonuclease IV
VLAIASQLSWVEPVLDFAHLHAVSDGGFTCADAFAEVLAAADPALGPGRPFHIHFSDISYANRNEFTVRADASTTSSLARRAHATALRAMSATSCRCCS